MISFPEGKGRTKQMMTSIELFHRGLCVPFLHACVWMCARVFARMCGRVRVCLHVCVDVCTCVFACMWMGVQQVLHGG